jgi:dephospho-CoA kinase
MYDAQVHPGKKVIGLVGGIGSGKSTVARMLADLGCVVADSDASARQALRDPAIKAKIVQKWGEVILDSGGEIDRSKLASIVFSDPQALKELEGLTHPWVEARRKEVFDAAGPQTPALVIDAPLLLEAGLETQCDAVIFVDADEEIRHQRVQAGRGWDAAELAKREERQISLDQKRRRADYVIQNNAGLGELKEQVRRILSMIVQSRQR